MYRLGLATAVSRKDLTYLWSWSTLVSRQNVGRHSETFICVCFFRNLSNQHLQFPCFVNKQKTLEVLGNFMGHRMGQVRVQTNTSKHESFMFMLTSYPCPQGITVCLRVPDCACRSQASARHAVSPVHRNNRNTS